MPAKSSKLCFRVFHKTISAMAEEAASPPEDVRDSTGSVFGVACKQVCFDSISLATTMLAYDSYIVPCYDGAVAEDVGGVYLCCSPRW